MLVLVGNHYTQEGGWWGRINKLFPSKTRCRKKTSERNTYIRPQISRTSYMQQIHSYFSYSPNLVPPITRAMSGVAGHCQYTTGNNLFVRGPLSWLHALHLHKFFLIHQSLGIELNYHKILITQERPTYPRFTRQHTWLVDELKPYWL